MNTDQVTATYYGATDTGRQRDNNEDNYIACDLNGGTHLLLAAIDGIGGYEGGEVAARIARDVIVDEVSRHEGSDWLGTLKNAVTLANNAIMDEKEHDQLRARMGCVISSCVIDLTERRLYMVHVGDSRLYQYTRSEGLKKLSHDHSLVGYREEIGMLTEEQAMKHPQRNIIERSLGEKRHTSDDPNFLDAGIFPILQPTQYLLCSDGLSDMLYSAQIASVLGTDMPAEEEVTTLIADANAAGGKDNITAVIAKVEVPAPPEMTVCADGEPMAPDHDLPRADYSDGLMPETPDVDEEYTVMLPGRQSPAPTRPVPTAAAPMVSPEKPTVGGKRRFNTFVITIAVSFLAGGTVGFFIGKWSNSFTNDAPVDSKTVQPDSIVNEINTPDSVFADPALVGREDADSMNKIISTKSQDNVAPE